MTIKKLLLWGSILFFAGGISYLLWMNSELNDGLPYIMAGTETIFVRSCKDDKNCLRVVRKYFPNCMNANEITKTTIFDYYDKFTNFMIGTHKCLEKHSKAPLPSLIDYLAGKDAEK